MVSKTVFNTTAKKTTRKTAKVKRPVLLKVRKQTANKTNNAGGRAYSYTEKHALAQTAMTGTFNGTFYQDAEKAFQAITGIVDAVQDNEYLAKLTVYARQKGAMKDLPAYLLAKLLERDTTLFRKVFGRVCNNGKMLRNMFTILRSDTFGNRNLSAGAIKRAFQSYFDAQTVEKLFHDSIGNDPTLKDIIRMSHVRPNTHEKDLLFKYLMGFPTEVDSLPEPVKSFERFKAGKIKTVPDVDFRFLSALPLTEKQWVQIALKANFTTTRMNLNTFARHGVFNDAAAVQAVADKLRDEAEVLRSKVFPYQLMMSFNAVENVPAEIKLALQDALEISLRNVPAVEGNVVVAVDVSGSMSSGAVTGYRGSATSKVTPIQVAALIGSAVLAKNPKAVIQPFDTSIHSTSLNPRDSVMTNTNILRKYGGGGTDCSLVLADIARKNKPVDTVIYVSDNESWAGFKGTYGRTGMSTHWQTIKAKNPNAKLVLIDLTIGNTSQMETRQDVLQLGGWSDQCFETINRFLTEGSTVEDAWVQEIESLVL